jgi:Mrp family chromosome partitioning ATPase/capsular polysaccharide biosynthesis protein
MRVLASRSDVGEMHESALVSVGHPTSYMDIPTDLAERDSVREFLDVLRRRKLALLLPIILTPIIAFGHSLLQDPLYAASADVLVTNGSVASGLSDLPGLSSPDQPERNAQTQVGLARLPRVAQLVIDKAPLSEDSGTFLGRSSVSADTNADIMRFSVEDPHADAAARLATLYAGQFTAYRNSLDLQALRATRAKIQQSLAKLVASGDHDSQLYNELKQAIRQLDAAEAVQGSATILVQPAVTSWQIAPHPKRDLVLALALGVLLGIGLAFLVERLDTRVRTPEEVESLLALPVLGEVPTPPALPPASQTTVAMLEFPYGPYAEGIRKLRANVEFVNRDFGARTIMVTSALAGEGKTTTAADLAVALARSGRRVTFCDLDSRSPAVGAAFGLVHRQGLVDVAYGAESLERATVAFQLPANSPVPARSGRAAFPVGRIEPSDAGDSPVGPHLDPKGQRGELRVLPFGRLRPPSPADFVGSSTVRKIISDLAESSDIVIIDTPPIIPVSDALIIGEYVDAAIIVSRITASTRPTLRSLRKLLGTFRTRVLGLAVTGVPEEVGYGPYYVGGPASTKPPVGLPTE